VRFARVYADASGSLGVAAVRGGLSGL